MKFNALHKLHFACSDGAYSRVTEREVIDCQITLTDHEADIVINVIGLEHIQRGNVKSDKIKALKKFKLYADDGEKDIELNLVFPKPEKDELRLYLKSSAFKPSPNDIWFLYPKDDRIILGAFSEKEWRSIGRNDEEDEIYQQIIEVAEPKIISPEYRVIAAQISQKRNPTLAVKRFDLAKYTCELDGQCRLFRSRCSGKNYLEAHHFIPLAFQRFFENSLDTIDNIIALCPFCHRAIHHADVDHTRSLIDSLTQQRKSLLDQYELTESTIYDYYNCETILTNG